MVGFLRIGRVGGGHNGGRSQVNFNFLSNGGDFPFLDVLKTCENWKYASAPNAIAFLDPALLDANGMPTSIQAGGYFGTTYIPTALERSGKYVVRWTASGGSSTLRSMGTLDPGNSYSITGTSGRAVFTPSSNTLNPGVSSMSGGYVTSIAVMHEDDEADWLAGEMFGTKFMERMREANFAVVRLSDWIPMNTGQITTWFTRKPEAYFSYSAQEYRASLYAGQTSNAGSAYSLTIPGGIVHAADETTWTPGDAPKHGDVLTVLFDLSASAPVSAAVSSAANTVLTIGTGTTDGIFTTVSETVTVSGTTGAWSGMNGDRAVVARSAGSVTIDFDSSALTPGGMTGTVRLYHKTCSLDVGSGAINILNDFSNPLTVGSNSYPAGGLANNGTGTLVYDSDLNAWIKQGSALGIDASGLRNGCPFEVMIRLCTELRAHPHLNVPVYACTPMTDYTTEAATYIRVSGPAWMKPRFEGPNELWNNIGGFYQTAYALTKATAYGWGADLHNWYGKAMSTIGQAVSAVYSGDRTKYDVLCGVQTGNGTTIGGTASSNPRLASTKYLLQSPQAGYTATPASDWVTCVCIAQYIGASSNGATEATAFAGKVFTASITDGVMTVTAINASNGAAIATGNTIFGTPIFTAGSVAAGVTIASLGTGTGGTGTYNLSASFSLSSRQMSAAADLTAPNTFAATCNSGAGAFTLSGLRTIYANWKAWAEAFGVQKICGYEGGYSVDYTAGGNSAKDLMVSASKQYSGLEAFLLETYSDLLALTDVDFTGEYPTCFQLSANPYRLGRSEDTWSVLESIHQTPNPPQWIAIIAFNHP